MEEWENDRCCATCGKGCTVKDEDGYLVVYCKPLEDYVATDYYCPGYSESLATGGD